MASTTDSQQICLIASPVDNFSCDVPQDASLDVDKVEASPHVGGHTLREFVKLLGNIFFERVTSPSAHLLDFTVLVAR